MKQYLQLLASLVAYTAQVDGSIVLAVKQTGFEDKKEDERYPWVVPVAWSAVKDGKSIKSGTYILTEASGEIKVEGIALVSVDFISIACDWSFYGDVKNEVS